MEAFIEFVKNWGYIAVFLGAIVEGESVILTASAMAALGYLSIIKIMLIAFTTTTIVDQGLFFVGRHYGPSLFKRYPKFQQPAERAFRLLHKYDVLFILSFRFIYGIRTLSPVVIGAGGVSAKRFIPLNILSALIWTTVSCMGGYMLGNVMLDVLNNFHTFQKYLIGIVALIVIIALAYWIIKRRKENL